MGLTAGRHQLADALKDATPLPVRRALVRSRLKARNLTSSWRSVPDFMIIGCQRGGTSSLYKYLGRHPQISPTLRKETEYFTVNHPQGEAWYRAHFPLRSRRRLTFEATPDYLLDPRAPQRAVALLPDAKHIVMLREPGARAMSHYKHNLRLGFETETFERALELEDERLASDLAALPGTPGGPLYDFRRYSYMTRGLYAEQVSRWFDSYPKDRFLFIESERFFSDPASCLAEILTFIDAEPWSPAEFRNYSYSASAPMEEDEPISDEARLMLDRRFAVSNDELRAMLPGVFRWLG